MVASTSKKTRMLRHVGLCEERAQRFDRRARLIALDSVPGFLDADPGAVRQGCRQLLGIFVMEVFAPTTAHHQRRAGHTRDGIPHRGPAAGALVGAAAEVPPVIPLPG